MDRSWIDERSKSCSLAIALTLERQLQRRHELADLLDRVLIAPERQSEEVRRSHRTGVRRRGTALVAGAHCGRDAVVMVGANRPDRAAHADRPGSASAADLRSQEFYEMGDSATLHYLILISDRKLDE